MQHFDRSVLTWGGLAGMLGSLLLLAVFAFLAAFVGLETLDATAAVERFPDIRWARIIENTAYLMTIAFWALHSVALFVVLRQTNYGAALAACLMSVLGLAVLAAGAIPHTASTAISDLYHARDAAAELKPVLIVAWQVSQAWVDTFVVTGIVLTPIGLFLFGLVMRHAQGYGPLVAWLSMLFGIAGIYAAVAALIEEGDVVGIGIFALVFFHLIVGWQSLRVARRAAVD